MSLPSEPITRKEQYLAKAAGQDVEIPAKPITREEEYLEAIAKKPGGGGGTSDYEQLEHKPQIGGVELSGNKTAAQLGLATETALGNKVDKVDGKGLSTNDYDDTAKGIVNGVTDALAGKQDALTAGQYIKMQGSIISVNRSIAVNVERKYVFRGSTGYRYVDTYIGDVFQSTTTCNYSDGQSGHHTFNDELDVRYDGLSYWVITNLKASTTQSQGYVKKIGFNDSSEYTQIFEIELDADKKLIIQSELDAAVNAIKDGQSIDSFADVETALASKADLTDLAPAFSTATAYTVGQYVSYGGNIYKCTSAHSAGAWAAGDFTLVAVGSELSELNSKIINETVLLRQLLTTTNATYDLTGNVTDYIFIAIILGWYEYDSNDNMIVIPSSAFLSNDYLLLYRKNDASTQAYAKINNRGYSDGVYSINAEGTEGVSIKVVGIIHK